MEDSTEGLEGSSKPYNFPSSKASFNRCCNPLQIDRHRVTVSLRKISKKIQEAYPHLSEHQLICASCRIKIDKILADSIKKAPQLSRGRIFTFLM